MLYVKYNTPIYLSLTQNCISKLTRNNYSSVFRGITFVSDDSCHTAGHGGDEVLAHFCGEFSSPKFFKKSTSSWIPRNCCAAALCFISDQRFSIGFRSGDCGGHCRRSNPCSRIHNLTDFALWHGALSCMKTVVLWMVIKHSNGFLELDGNAHCSLWILVVRKSPNVEERLPRPDADMHL